MTPFSACLRIINKNKILIIAITALLLLFGYFNAQNNSGGDTSFRSEKPSVTIINNDEGGEIAAGLTEYLKKNCEVKKFATKEELDDALFYRKVSYVITIPDGFTDSLMNGGDPEIETRSTGTSYSSLAGTMLQQYVRTVKEYSGSADDAAEVVDLVSKSLDKSASVKIDRVSDVDAEELSSAAAYFNFENYAFILAVIYVVGIILMSFREDNTRRRIIAGGMPLRRHDRQLILCCSLFALAMWAFYTVMGLLLFRNAMWSANGALFALNSFVFMLCVLLLGFMIAELVRTRNALNGVMNVVALGTSFICGAFVPLYLLPRWVVKSAHVLPSYWFVVNNDEIAALDTVTKDALAPILANMGAVIGFAVLFFALSQFFASRAAKTGAA